MYERFQKLCKLKGVTVRQVANATGLQESSLSNWKKRKGGINTDTLIKICDYFEVSTDWMLTGEDSNILKREQELDDISSILEDAGYRLDCEDYYSDFFRITDKKGQTVASYYDYELLTLYQSLKKLKKLSADMLIQKAPVHAKQISTQMQKDKTFMDHIHRLFALPEEYREKIYEQIEFQEGKAEKDNSDFERGKREA